MWLFNGSFVAFCCLIKKTFVTWLIHSSASAEDRHFIQISGTDGHVTYINKEDLSRPMYRQDILLATSTNSVKRHGTHPQSIVSVSGVDTTPSCWDKCCIPESIKSTLKTMLNFSVLRDARFILICLGSFTSNGNIQPPFLYIDKRAEMIGIDNIIALPLVSIIGTCSIRGLHDCQWNLVILFAYIIPKCVYVIYAHEN